MDVEQVDSGGREDGHAACPARVELALEVRPDPLQVVPQLDSLVVRQGILAQLPLDPVEQRLELGRALPWGRELARVEVQIQAEDLVTLRPQRRELTQPLLVQHGRILSALGARDGVPRPRLPYNDPVLGLVGYPRTVTLTR